MIKKYDLHIHTCYSKCAISKPESILKKAKEKDLNGIAITDHNTIKGALKVKKLNKDPTFEVIVGEEVKTDKGELLVYYLKKEIKPGKIEDILKQVKKQKAICSIAHPFSFGIRKKSRIDLTKLVNKIDAVEIFNARSYIPYENRKAGQLAKRFNLAEIGGSDSHFPWTIGKGYTLFKGNLKKSIKLKNTKSKGSVSFSLINRLLSLFVKSWKITFS